MLRSYPILPSAVQGQDECTNPVEAAEDEHNVQEVHEQINEEEHNVPEIEEVGGQGVADLGETVPSIVQQMENENLEATHMEEYGDSSDEEYPVPSDWRNPGFGNPIAHDARTNKFQYRENEVVQGLCMIAVRLLRRQ